jgi:membrane protein implicated in regulation of membrane protease activity
LRRTAARGTRDRHGDPIWIIAGFALAIVELLTGTLPADARCGVRRRGDSGAGQGFRCRPWLPAGIAAAGCWAVHIWRAKNAEQMAPVDAGQPANFESWIDESAGLARVRYRGASWEARVAAGGEGAGGLQPGALLYVTQTRGSMLEVARNRPV